MGFYGLDVGKFHVDLHHNGEDRRYEHAPGGIAAMIADMAAARCIVMESTGGYERGLLADLQGAGLPVRRVNPRRIRSFAVSAGVMAKTDRADARIMAVYARKMIEEEAPPVMDDAWHRARALWERREMVMGDIRREKCRRQHARDPLIERHVEENVQRLQAQADELEEATLSALCGSAARDTMDRLSKFDGVGPKVALCLTLFLPELGRLPSPKIASLAGLAPFAKDSGTSVRGKRFIQGGRNIPRRALFIAALTAKARAPYDRLWHRLHECRDRPKKVAIIAVARKLLLHINAVETRWKKSGNPT